MFSTLIKTLLLFIKSVFAEIKSTKDSH